MVGATYHGTSTSRVDCQICSLGGHIANVMKLVTTYEIYPIFGTNQR